MVPIKIENQMDKKMELDMARAGIPGPQKYVK